MEKNERATHSGDRRERRDYGSRNKYESDRTGAKTRPNDGTNSKVVSRDADVPTIRPEPSISEDCEPPAPKSIPIINSHRLAWPGIHAKGCSFGCTSRNQHYSRWRDAYYQHLWDIYTVFLDEINPSKVNFDLFSEFVHRNSSGYISKFA